MNDFGSVYIFTHISIYDIDEYKYIQKYMHIYLKHLNMMRQRMFLNVFAYVYIYIYIYIYSCIYTILRRIRDLYL
jgi:hypothetical protein